MALTIDQLYDKYADRAPDPGGLEFWTKGFLGEGDTTIDANEEASFARAVAEARAQGTEPAAKTTAPATTTTNTNTGGITNLPTTEATPTSVIGTPVISSPLSLLDTNTSTAVDTPNYRQMVIDAYGTIGRTGFGTEASNIDKQGADEWTKALETGKIKPEDWNKTFQSAVTDYIATNPNDKYTQYVKNYLGLPNTTTATSPLNSTATLFEDTFGRKPTQDEINMFGDTVESRELDSFFGTARNEVVNTMPTTGAVGNLAKQILAQGTTSQWGGEGYGSTTKNAYDMAAMLASQGFKDINDFGKVAAYAPLQEIGKTYNGQQVVTYLVDDGGVRNAVRMPDGGVDADGNPTTKMVDIPSNAKLESVYGQYDPTYDTVSRVDPSKIKTVDGQAVVETGGTTFGNVKTGKAIESFYDKAGGNVWGGTFAGKDSTAYGVQFDNSGKPIFYSQYGGDSSDIGDLQPLLSIASLVPGIAPFAMAANAAISASQGNMAGAILSGLGASGAFAGGVMAEIDALANAGDFAGANALWEGSLLAQNAGNIATATNVARGLNAIDKRNIAGAINAGLSLGGVSVSPELRTAATLFNAATAIGSGDTASMLDAASALTGSSDAKLAASALRFIDAIQSENPTAIINATKGFTSTVKSATDTSQVFKAFSNKIASGETVENTLASLSSGTDADVNLPSGLQLAGVTNGTTSDAGSGFNVGVTGRPIFAEDSRASKIEVPFGYRILSASETDNKPAGSFVDNTTGAWMAPITDVSKLDTSRLQSDIDLFKSSMGDLDRATVSSDGTSNVSSGSLDALTSYLDGTDSVSSNNSSNNSATRGLDSVNTSNSASTSNNTINAKSGLNSVSGDGIEELVITDKRPIDELVITADRPANVIVNDDNTTTTVVVDNDGKVTTHDCAAGYHWNEATQACVADAKVVTPKVNIPVVNTPTVKTPVTMTSPLSGVGTPPPVLDTSEKMLKGAPAQKRMELAKLQQLFASLTPEMAAVLSERGFEPPKFKEDKVEETPSAKAETSVFGNLSDELYRPTFMATGGSVLESMKPKYIEYPKHLSAAPVVGTGGVDSPLKLAALKHLYQTVGKPMRELGGLAQGGLPQKYAKASPKGHKPEFITGLTGYYATGKGTGQSDDIPAMLHDGDYVIDADAVAALGDGSSKAGAEALSEFQSQVPHSMSTGGQAVPAKIADGEYVFPEAFVSAIGEGDNKLGAKRLDAMREELRAHKRSAPTSKIPPKAKSPLDYLRMAKG